MNVEIGTVAAQFPEKEYINEILVAVRVLHLILISLSLNVVNRNHLVKRLGGVLAV